VYRDLATRRSGKEREILRLAEAEERHAAHWADLLGDDVGPVRRGAPRMRLLAFLARRLGSVFVLALAQRAEPVRRIGFRTSRPSAGCCRR
jgi:vacuolar iron transporter family protein